jgi:hypothetical protein
MTESRPKQHRPDSQQFPPIRFRFREFLMPLRVLSERSIPLLRVDLPSPFHLFVLFHLFSPIHDRFSGISSAGRPFAIKTAARSYVGRS